MASVDMSDEQRIESKYVFNEMNYNDVLRWVKLSNLGCTEIYHERRINSIYFDTRDYYSFIDNIEGHGRRCKFRIRWYGESNVPPTTANLEIKLRSNDIVFKKRYLIDDKDFLLEMFRGALSTKEIKWTEKFPYLENMPDIISSMLKILTPKVFISYSRNYYVSRDRNFRITLDRNISYSKYGSSFCIREKENVMEIKTENKEATLSNLVDNHKIPALKSRNSKYVKAVSLAAPHSLPLVVSDIY